MITQTSLQGLDEDAFADVLAKALETGAYQHLLTPAVVGRTIAALATLRIALERQVTRLHEQIHALHGQPARQQRTEIRRALARIGARQRELRLLQGLAAQVRRDAGRERQEAIEAAAAERKRKLRTDHLAGVEQKSKATREAVRLLALAIQRHRLATIETGLAPESADQRLWAVLDEVTVPYRSRTATLTEMLGAGAWTAGPSGGGDA